VNSSSSPQELLHRIAQIQRMERGKLCLLREGPNGPYYNHQTWQDGKNVCRYVPQDQLPALEEAIAGYEKFQQLIQQYAEVVIQKTRAELASGLKKKSAPPNSSLPRIKRLES
jgi:hypothetical protein